MTMQPTKTMSNGTVDEDSLDFRKIIQQFGPYWYIFLISLFLGLAGAYLINTIKEPVYRASSTMLIQEDRSRTSVMRQMELFNNRSNVINEVTILESLTLIDTVVNKMDVAVSYYEIERILGFNRRSELYGNSPIRVIFDNNNPEPLRVPVTLQIIDENWYEITDVKGLRGLTESRQFFFGQRVEGEGYSFTINRVKPYNNEVHDSRRYKFIINDPLNLVRNYKSSLTIEPLLPESSVFQVSFKATNRQKAIDFTNTLINTFLNHNLREKNQTAQNTVQFIENQIALTAGNLDVTEGRLQNFREKEQLLDISQIASQLVDELQVLDKERSLEEVKQSYYSFLQEYISDRRDFSEVFGPSALGIDDPILSNHLVELSNLHTERGRLLLTTTERSPSVQAIDQNIRQVKATLEENIRNIQAASEILMTDLNRRINRIEQRIGQLPSTERELIGIQRMFNITDATYNFLLEKQAEAGIALASNMADHKVIDAARFASLVSPRKTLNYALGILLGIFLPVIIIGGRDYFNTRIVSKEDVARALNFPIVGIVPRHKPLLKYGSVDIVVFDNSHPPVTEAFRNIRSNLHFFSPKRQNNLIVVTSTRAGEGKTFTSVNLAAVLAMSNYRTLYIDADIRKVQPNQFTMNMIQLGLSNYLIGRAELEDVINPSSYNENLFIMNSGIVSPNPAELIESPEMMRLLTEELKDYDYIIVDTSPVGLVADAKPLMSKARLNMFVLRHNFSCHEDMDFIKDYTNQAGLKNAVIVINDIKHSKKGYGYGYGFGYGSGYGYIPQKTAHAKT